MIALINMIFLFGYNNDNTRKILFEVVISTNPKFIENTAVEKYQDQNFTHA